MCQEEPVFHLLEARMNPTPLIAARQMPGSRRSQDASTKASDCLTAYVDHRSRQKSRAIGRRKVLHHLISLRAAKFPIQWKEDGFHVWYYLQFLDIVFSGTFRTLDLVFKPIAEQLEITTTNSIWQQNLDTMVHGMRWLNGGALAYLGIQILRTVNAFSVDVSSERTFLHPFPSIPV